MKSVLTIVLILTCLVGVSQSTSSVAEIAHDSIEEDSGNEWRMLFGLDSRNSFALGHKARFFGLRIGARLNRKHRFGFGFYGLTKPIFIEENPPLEEPDVYDTMNLKVDFNYSTIFYERVLKWHPRYEITLPIHLGTGRISTSYLDTTLTYQPWAQRSGSIPLTELSLAGTYKFIRFMSIQGDVGYRFILTSNRPARKAFSSAIYRVGLSLELGEVWRAIFRKKYPEENEYWDEQRRKRKDRRAARRAE